MTTRILSHLTSFSLALCLTTLSPWAAAATNDAKATELREQAIFDDYLNLRFDEAEARLNEAIRLCDSGCSSGVKAKLYRDLGVVYVAGLKQRDAGVGMFVEAVTLDPNIQLDPDLTSDELQEAMAEARELAGAAPPPEAPPGQPPPATTELLPVEDYEGVFHTPPSEQLVNTPLPLYVEVRDQDWTAKVAKVKLYFRGFGMVRFKEVELPKIGEFGYGIELSCDEVGKSPGKVDYYVVIIDEDGDEAAGIGSEAAPRSVAIKQQIDASPAPIPGQEMPASCPSAAPGGGPPGMGESPSSAPLKIEDCPPDFPGCEPEPVDDEPEPPEHMQFKRHWVSLGGQVDFVLMNAAADACAGSFTSELTCYEGDTYWDPATKGNRIDVDGDGVFDDSGSIGGGFALGTKRVLVGYDYAITQNILAGVRLGFAFGGGPTLVAASGQRSNDFFPFHAEVRGAYWFGSKVLQDQFFRPFVQLSVGGAQVDAMLETEVIDEERGSCEPDSSGNRACAVPVDVWRKTGNFFVSAGGGAVLAFTPTIGLNLEARFMQMLPASGSAIAAGGGMVFGF